MLQAEFLSWVHVGLLIFQHGLLHDLCSAVCEPQTQGEKEIVKESIFSHHFICSTLNLNFLPHYFGVLKYPFLCMDIRNDKAPSFFRLKYESCKSYNHSDLLLVKTLTCGHMPSCGSELGQGDAWPRIYNDSKHPIWVHRGTLLFLYTRTLLHNSHVLTSYSRGMEWETIKGLNTAAQNSDCGPQNGTYKHGSHGRALELSGPDLE